MKQDAKITIRISKEDLDKFNEIADKNAINKSKLFRQWIKNFIKENEKN